MSKSKQEPKPEQKPETPAKPEPKPEPPVVRQDRWRLRPVGSAVEWIEVAADTLEDAIRAYNAVAKSPGTVLPRKRLDVERV